jgi:hypothetical protein
MRRLLVAGRQATTSASYMHPGCLDWDTHCPPDEQENRRNLRLWERMDEDEGQPTLEAWAMFWRHEGTFDLFVSPALQARRCTRLSWMSMWPGPKRGRVRLG